LAPKYSKHIIEKSEKLKNNKVYDGMDFRNTDELSRKQRVMFYPKQHPKMLNNADTNIISYKPQAFPLTEFEKVPAAVVQYNDPEFESPKDSRQIDIGILGPPNAGKSSLMNKLISANVSAVSSKYGTTFEKIEGVYTDIQERVQIVFNDTPGATKVSNSIRSKRIITRAWSLIPDCDKILFVIDSVKHLDIVTREAIKRLLSQKFSPSMLKVINKIKSSNEEDITIDQLIKIQEEVEKSGVDKLDYESKNLSTVLIMNKVDLVTNKRKLKSLQEELEDIGSFDKVFHISCETGYGLDSLLNFLKSEAPRRPWRFHPEIKSTQSDQEKCEEIFRGLIFNRFYKEVPYDTMVTMTSWVPFNNGELKIKFQVEVRYEHQIPMFLGEKGKTFKELREELDKELTKFYQMPVKTVINIVTRRRGLRLEALNEKAAGV
jgi:GTP-binding protein Era